MKRQPHNSSYFMRCLSQLGQEVKEEEVKVVFRGFNVLPLVVFPDVVSECFLALKWLPRK